MNFLKRWLKDAILEALQGETTEPPAVVGTLRARPGQALDQVRWLWAPTPDHDYDMAAYAFNAWASTAIHRLSEMASVARLQIRGRKDVARMYDEHPLMSLLGEFGSPNDVQDEIEFLMQLHLHRRTYGNAYIYLGNSPGAPRELFLLEPSLMVAVPGRSSTIGSYLYRKMGHEYRIAAEQILHLRMVHALPNGVYYGRSAISRLEMEINSDRQMALWNTQLFTSGVPSGILVVDETVGDSERKRIEDELHASHALRRMVAVVRAKAGSVVWQDAGLRHRDLEFKDGRLLSRQAVFDAMGFHVGLVSQASTEAHARVAERLVLNGVWQHNRMVASKLNELLAYFPGASRYQVVFEDIRAVDWDQESKKVAAQLKFMTRDEVRAERGLGPYPEEEMNGTSSEAELGADKRARAAADRIGVADQDDSGAAEGNGGSDS